MKCQECGSENIPWAKTCRSCGKVLRETPPKYISEEPEARVSKVLDKTPSQSRVEPREVSQKLRMEYSVMHREPTARTIEALCGLMVHLGKSQVSVRAMMEEAVSLIQKLFSIREVAIGLKNPVDGFYRYEVLAGFRPDAESTLRRIQYSEADFWDQNKYKCTNISKLTRLFLAEDSPYADGEKDSYSRPFMLEAKRSFPDEALEGDYIDVVIPGLSGEALGWIEMSGTRSGKLPDALTIRWVEAIATMIGSGIVCNDIRRVMARESAKKPIS